jgi:hypothetical protein
MYDDGTSYFNSDNPYSTELLNGWPLETDDNFPGLGEIEALSTVSGSCSGQDPVGITPLSGKCTQIRNFSDGLSFATFTVSWNLAIVFGGSGAVATRCFTSGPADSVAVGSSVPFPITTSGSPAPKIKEKGKLPKGVKFHKGTGSATIKGTPTSTKHRSTVGTYHLTLTATFGKGKTKQVVTQAFTLTVT